MSITIPGGGSFQNSAKPWLTPQVLVDINLVDVDALVNQTIVDGVLTGPADRIINAEIQLIYISENEISAQLENVLSSVENAIILDLNPYVRGSREHITKPDGVINPMNFQFGLQIDNTQEIRYVSVWIQSQKLKVDYATQAFTRVKTYVITALAS